jgi:integrase/recombinase XerD
MALTAKTLNKAVDEYLVRTQANRAYKTFLAYNRVLQDYLDVVGERRPYDELQREDVHQYTTWLRQKGVDNRTLYNRLSVLKTFYTEHDVKWPMRKTDRIRYVKRSVEAYSKPDITRLLAVSDVDEADLWLFFLNTGAREGETMHAEYSDLDWDRRRFNINAKSGWVPKDKEEGAIPVDSEFIQRMKARRQRYPNDRLIFPNADGNPQGHMLRMLQRCAKRGGLDPSYHGLHKFRKTFATLHHQNGVPVRTIQLWLRHSSLEVTLRYLAAGDDEEQRSRVESTFSFAVV